LQGQAAAEQDDEPGEEGVEFVADVGDPGVAVAGEQQARLVDGEPGGRRRTGIEPASDAARRSLVLKTRGTTRNPDASDPDFTDSSP
jgi:hypothetical protein